MRKDVGQTVWREKLLPAMSMHVERLITNRNDLITDIAADYKEFKQRIFATLKLRFATGPTLVSCVPCTNPCEFDAVVAECHEID